MEIFLPMGDGVDFVSVLWKCKEEVCSDTVGSAV